MSEETNSPQPDKPSKSEEAGAEAEVVAAAGADSELSSADAADVSPAPKPEAAPTAAAASATADNAFSEEGGEDAGAVPTGAKFEGDISMRRSPWKSSIAAIKYVHEAAKTDYVQIRTSDRVTVIALLFFSIAEILSVVYSPLRDFRFAFMCCCDVILGACIVLFLIYRIGILSSLNTRQAIITWQMMMGCVFLGIFICLNTIFAIAYLVETFFPHTLP